MELHPESDLPHRSRVRAQVAGIVLVLVILVVHRLSNNNIIIKQFINLISWPRVRNILYILLPTYHKPTKTFYKNKRGEVDDLVGQRISISQSSFRKWISVWTRYIIILCHYINCLSYYVQGIFYY